MHELSIVDGILKIIAAEKKKHKFSRVKTIEIVCGQYNCISEENLQFCFEVASGNTEKGPCTPSGTKLKVIRAAQRYRCQGCSKEFKKEIRQCPACASKNIIPLMDNHIYIRSLEVE